MCKSAWLQTLRSLKLSVKSFWMKARIVTSDACLVALASECSGSFAWESDRLSLANLRRDWSGGSWRRKRKRSIERWRDRKLRTAGRVHRLRVFHERRFGQSVSHVLQLPEIVEVKSGPV